MKLRLGKRLVSLICAAIVGMTSIMLAQPAASPLMIQGMDQSTINGARVRAMGGAGIANTNDATALFTNPAALSQLTSWEVRGGGMLGTVMNQQDQQWVPMRELPGISLLFESMTGTVKIPDSLGRPGLPLSAWSTVQQQYDNLGPNYQRHASSTKPMSLAAAVPFALAHMKLVAGVGVAQAIDLDHYYQNNNAMSPYLGQLRPDPQLITIRNDTTQTRWYQYTQTRDGAIYGITPGVSVTLLPELTVGASATIYTGSSNDNEYRQDRGLINIAIVNAVAANFMVDTVRYYQSASGTSSYKGSGMTFGVQYEQKHFTIGATVKPSMTLTRTWSRDVAVIDTTRKALPIRVDPLSSRLYHESGTDDVTFPMSYAIGVAVKPNDQWVLAFDYEMRNLADAEVNSSVMSSEPSTLALDGTSKPWVNKRAAMRFGAEYRASEGLALRAGYRQDIQAFAPDGAAIIGDPASGDTYSLGAGFHAGPFLVDIAYEYALLKYQDIYQSNVNYNTREQHHLFVEFAYRF